MLPFVTSALRNISSAPPDSSSGASRQTYSAGLRFLHRLLLSRMRTRNASRADLFFVPQWEGLLGYFGRGFGAFQGFQPQLDLVLESAAFTSSGLRLNPRNHLAVYTADMTLSCDRVYVDGERRLDALARRFITLQYSGRVDCAGRCHAKNACCRGCFDSVDVVIPSVIPTAAAPSERICSRKASVFRFDFEGGWTHTLWKGRKELVSNVQVERAAAKEFVRELRRRPPSPDNRTAPYSHNVTGAAAEAATLALVNTNRSDFGSYFGFHAAGYGTWSARIWDYITRCVVPIIMTDGVILPFERFIHYELFASKLLSTSYALPARRDPNTSESSSGAPTGSKPMTMAVGLHELSRLTRAASEHTATMHGRKAVAAAPMQRHSPMDDVHATLMSVASWLDWHSTDPYSHPFTLTMLELLCFTDHRHRKGVLEMCSRDRAGIAMREFLPQGLVSGA